MKSVSLAAGASNPRLEKPSNQRRYVSRFWIGLALIAVLAAVPRLLSYQFSLPYIDHPDEPDFYQTGQEMRGLFDNYNYHFGYPPAYLYFNMFTQIIVEPLGIQGLSPTIRLLRQVSLIANLLTLVVIALTARKAAGSFAAGDLAGWVAGAAWGIPPLIFEGTLYATPDPFVYLTTAAAIWLAVEALYTPRRAHWCIWSVLAGVLAVLFKYPALPALVPGVLAALLLYMRERRGALRLALLIVIAAAVTVWTGLKIIALGDHEHNEGAIVRDEGLVNLLNPERVLNNIAVTIAPLNATAFVVICALAAISYLAARRRNQARVRLEVVILCAAMWVALAWLAAAFSRVTVTERLRDVLPATAAAAIIFGIASAQALNLVPTRYGTIGRAAFLLNLVVIVIGPQFSRDLQLTANFQLPDRRVAFRQWADINLDPGTVLVNVDNQKTFNPFWGGLIGRKWFDWWEGSITSQTVDEWREETGIAYAAIPVYRLDEMRADSDGQAQLAEMLHLRDFHGGAPARGPEFEVYRLWRMQHEIEAAIGDSIRLVGYDQNADAFAAGESVELRFYWQAASTPAANYSLYIHLTAPDSRDVLAQVDGAPAALERPTLTWDAPDETIISQPFTLALPADLAGGNYRILIGLYDYLTGERLPVSGETLESLGDALVLGHIAVND